MIIHEIKLTDEQLNLLVERLGCPSSYNLETTRCKTYGTDKTCTECIKNAILANKEDIVGKRECKSCFDKENCSILEGDSETTGCDMGEPAKEVSINIDERYKKWSGESHLDKRGV